MSGDVGLSVGAFAARDAVAVASALAAAGDSAVVGLAGALAATGSPSELLAGPQFGDLLAQIRNLWPNALVLVDMPPVSLTDEALLIGPRVDAILLVVSEGMTERKLVVQALATLSEFTLAGVVVNRSSDSHTVEYSRYTA